MRFPRIRFRRGILAVAALIGAAALALPTAAQQFSADFVNSRGDSGGGDAAPKKIYVADGKVRLEGVGMRGGTLLADAKANTAVILMSQQKIYMDAAKMGMLAQAFMPVDPDNPCPQWQKMADDMHRQNLSDGGTWTCKRIGPETVNGRSAIKFQATSPKGETSDGWIDEKLHCLIKTASAGGHLMEMRNIQEGPQQASLFEIPAGFKKMDMRQMMQEMLQKGQQPPG